MRFPRALDGRTCADIEALFAGERVFVERVRSGRRLFEREPGRRLRAGDRVVLSGRRQVLVGDSNPLRAYEAEDPELLDIPTVSVDVVLTSKEFAEKQPAASSPRASVRAASSCASSRARGRSCPSRPRRASSAATC